MLRIISALADCFTIAASSIAVYLFLFQRDKISAAFKTLINYSTQLTLTELTSKIDRLNDLNANDELQNSQVINILNEIEGQIKGNPRLIKQFPEVIAEIEPFSSQRSKITEPKKRSVVALLREKIRSYDVDFKNS